MIALDLPGFGDVARCPPSEISIAGYGRVVAELLRALGLDRVVVVGNSMGGFIAAELAIQHPDRVERLVLVSAAGVSQIERREAPALIGRGAGRRLLATAARPQQRIGAPAAAAPHGAARWSPATRRRLQADVACEGS